MLNSLGAEKLFCLFFRPQVSSALYFTHNAALGPPYRVLVDTNFINFSIQNKVSVDGYCHFEYAILFCSFGLFVVAKSRHVSVQ